MIVGPRKPCDPPVTLDELCRHAPKCSCRTVKNFESVPDEAMELWLAGELTAEHEEYGDWFDCIEQAQAQLEKAWQAVYEATCRRWPAGCKAIFRLCFPPCPPCPPCDSCGTPIGYDVPELDCYIPVVSAAEIVCFGEDGSEEVTPVNVPNHPPVEGAPFQLTKDDRIECIRLKKGGPLTPWPQDCLDVAWGSPGTCVLRLTIDPDCVPVEVCDALIEEAARRIGECGNHTDGCSVVGAESVTEDGVTFGLGGNTERKSSLEQLRDKYENEGWRGGCPTIDPKCPAPIVRDCQWVGHGSD